MNEDLYRRTCINNTHLKTHSRILYRVIVELQTITLYTNTSHRLFQSLSYKLHTTFPQSIQQSLESLGASLLYDKQ